ncbi:hypothetical protein ACLQ3A_03120 [Micromonospora zamorensis]|uniref:hypothetical protein n=1 Tax=Micromonospora zamorensis TaxID=709883 RepID=UPI002E2B7667|nr:hypothetical protein [Micromonospora zamorensis]
MTAAAGAVVTLAQLNLPSRPFWDEQVVAQWLSVSLLAFFICYDAARSVNYALRATRIREYDKDLRAALSAIIASVVESTGAPWDEIAVHYYRRRGILLRRRLFQVAAVQAGADIANATQPIRWGEGVVGVAVDDQVILGEEWRQFVRTATEEGPSAWARRSKRDRYGLTWGQLRRSAQPQGMIASPTFDPDGRPEGCILVSGPLKRVDLEGEAMGRTLDNLATVLDRLGQPPSGWWDAHVN